MKRESNLNLRHYQQLAQCALVRMKSKKNNKYAEKLILRVLNLSIKTTRRCRLKLQSVFEHAAKTQRDKCFWLFCPFSAKPS